MVMLRIRCQRRFSCVRRQRGVALITVMLVFVLVAVIATEMLRRSQLNLRSVGNLIETRQAYYYALGGEAYALQLLAKDLNEHPDIDALNEAWAQTKEQQPFEIDNGSMQVEINDLQGRFNLNSVSATNLTGLELLLQVLQLNKSYAKEWLDWINKTEIRSASGVTRGEADITALRLLPSMQPQDYAKLAPHVTVLPDSSAKININTADDKVLQAIWPSRSAQIIAKQKSGGYRSVEDAAITIDDATVTSNFFEVVVTVNYEKRWQRVRTVLQRTQNPVAITVISRVRSPLIDDLAF